MPHCSLVCVIGTVSLPALSPTFFRWQIGQGDVRWMWLPEVHEEDSKGELLKWQWPLTSELHSYCYVTSLLTVTSPSQTAPPMCVHAHACARGWHQVFFLRSCRLDWPRIQWFPCACLLSAGIKGACLHCLACELTFIRHVLWLFFFLMFRHTKIFLCFSCQFFFQKYVSENCPLPPSSECLLSCSQSHLLAALSSCRPKAGWRHA